MKKFVATMLTIIVGSTFAANIVYDYKASIKRIEAVYSVKKLAKTPYVTDAYKTKSDSIVGYIVLPACATCADEDDEIVTDFTAIEDWNSENSNVGYFIRKGDKLSKKLGKPFIAKAPVEASAAMFGAYTPMLSGTATQVLPYATVKSNKYAWMALSFTIPFSEQTVDSGNVLKKYAGEDLNYGFLGFDNSGAVNVANAGFGTVKVVTEAAKLGFCSYKPGTSCQIVFSISGSTVGESEYQGPCGVTPMWDICYSEPQTEDDDDYVVNDATIHGTWTLKYNNKLSSYDDDEKEEQIIKKLGGKSLADVYEAAEEEGDDDDDDDDDDSDDTPSDDDSDDTPSDDDDTPSDDDDDTPTGDDDDDDTPTQE